MSEVVSAKQAFDKTCLLCGNSNAQAVPRLASQGRDVSDQLRVAGKAADQV